MKKKFKIISLTQGYETVVDIEDYDWIVAVGSWYAQRSRGNRICAVRSAKQLNGKQKTILMSRVIMQASQNLQVDHINGNPLDNRRSNLRLCIHSQNQMNRGSDRGSASRFKGVYWYKQVKKWRAIIGFNRKIKHLGYFDDEIEAAKARDKATKKYHGEFAKLNFPELKRRKKRKLKK